MYEPLLLLSLPDDDLSCVFDALPGHLIPVCARVCSRMLRLVDDEQRWRRAVARSFEASTHPCSVVSSPFATWKSLFRICFCTLHHSVSGLLACARAYRGGESYALLGGECVPRSPLLRVSSDCNRRSEQFLDLIPVSMNTTISSMSSCVEPDSLYSAFETILYIPLGPRMNIADVYDNYVAGEGRSTSPPLSADLYTAINGSDAKEPTSTSSFPTARCFSLFPWETSAPPGEGIRLLLQFERPCLLTGAIVCNPGPANRFPVREAAVHVGMTVTEATTRTDAFVRLSFPRQMHVNHEALAFAPPVLARFAVVHLVSAFDEGRLCAPDRVRFDVRAVGLFGTELRDVRFA
jgi:hypothetical protein